MKKIIFTQKNEKNRDVSLYDIGCGVYLLRCIFCKNQKKMQISQKNAIFTKKNIYY